MTDSTDDTLDSTDLDTDEVLPPSRASVIVVAVVFAVLQLYPLFLAISNLIALPQYYAALNLGDRVPWWLLVLGVLVPVASYVAALRVARGRMLSHRVLVLAVGLALTSTVMLSMSTLAPILLTLSIEG